ncbi:MAG: lipoyl(octanoyl) transferase LipB [Anaerolineales bacterium]|jgi:lipoate-protein ligase B
MTTASPRTLHIYHLGQVEYEQAGILQESLAREIGEHDYPDSLLLLEHPHVYTFGRRGDERHLLWNMETLKEKGLSVYWSDRGGDVTYHGPGQLVAYPLLNLGTVQQDGRLPQADYVGYIRKLEKVIIKALAELGVVSGQITNLTGVWVQPDVASRCPHCPPAARKHPSKIASIGVKVDARGISRHGFALNVDPDMSFWEGIVACGIADYPAVSLAQLLDPAPSMDETVTAVTAAFLQLFDYQNVKYHSSPPQLEHPSG